MGRGSSDNKPPEHDWVGEGLGGLRRLGWRRFLLLLAATLVVLALCLMLEIDAMITAVVLASINIGAGALLATRGR